MTFPFLEDPFGRGRRKRGENLRPTKRNYRKRAARAADRRARLARRKNRGK